MGDALGHNAHPIHISTPNRAQNLVQKGHCWGWHTVVVIVERFCQASVWCYCSYTCSETSELLLACAFGMCWGKGFSILFGMQAMIQREASTEVNDVAIGQCWMMPFGALVLDTKYQPHVKWHVPKRHPLRSIARRQLNQQGKAPRHITWHAQQGKTDQYTCQQTTGQCLSGQGTITQYISRLLCRSTQWCWYVTCDAL